MSHSRRFGRKPTIWRQVAGIVVVLALLLYQGLQDQEQEPVSAGTHHVQRVVDGDTLLLQGGERIRLIGVDTPEVHTEGQPHEPFGDEASAFTKKHVEGREVRLEFDLERVDQYGRTLAFVYLDDWFLNEELIRAGLSRAETQYPYSAQMKRRFRSAEDEARTAKVGLWSIPQNRSSRD